MKFRETNCLGPTGNFKGTHFFLCLQTGRVIKHKQSNKSPLPDRVKNKMNKWGLWDGKKGRLYFCNCKNKPFDWDLEDEEILVEGNTVEPVPKAAFPDIPSKCQG